MPLTSVRIAVVSFSPIVPPSVAFPELLHSFHDFVRRRNSVCKKSEVDERCRVAVAPFGMPGGSCRIPCNDDLESLLEQITQVSFDTHVCQHPAEDDLADAVLAQLQDEVVGLRTKHPVRANNDGFAVINVRLKAIEPVGARPGEAVEAQSSTASEHLGLHLIGLEGSVEFPSTVRGEEVVWRDEDLESVLLRGLEDALHVLDGLVLPDAVADRPPREAFVTQDFILRVDEYHCGVVLV